VELCAYELTISPQGLQNSALPSNAMPHQWQNFLRVAAVSVSLAMSKKVFASVVVTFVIVDAALQGQDYSWFFLPFLHR